MKYRESETEREKMVLRERERDGKQTKKDRAEQKNERERAI